MKFTNSEHTEAVHNGSSGRVEDLIRLGYITNSDITNAEPYVEPVPSPKEVRAAAMLEGTEILGVVCSAHKEDQWGLNSVENWVLSGNEVMFQFKNGNKLLLTSINWAEFQSLWVPFRASFF